MFNFFLKSILIDHRSFGLLQKILCISKDIPTERPRDFNMAQTPNEDICFLWWHVKIRVREWTLTDFQTSYNLFLKTNNLLSIVEPRLERQSSVLGSH